MSPAKKKMRKVTISETQELEVLRKIVELTNSELDLKPVLKEVVKIVTKTTQADSVLIYLFDDKRKSLTLMASKTPHKKELGKITLRSGEGITGWVAKENEPVAIKSNAYQDSRFINFDVLPEDKYEAFLSIPVVYKNKAIGVINIQHKKTQDYDSSLIELISLIAKQISGVIMNAQLFDDAKNKAIQFDSIIKVSQSITSEGYLDEILNLIVVVTAGMLDSKICSIMLLDKKRNELAIKATQSLSREYKQKPNLKVNTSLLGEVVKKKKPLAIEDVRDEKKYCFRDLAVKEGLSSMVAVPMILKDKVIGIINVYTKNKHYFTTEEIDVLQVIGNQAAVAIENTQWMEEAMKAKEALETRKLVERAKGILMHINGLSEAAAHKLIHKKSMDSCKTMKEVAESVILMDDLQKSMK